MMKTFKEFITERKSSYEILKANRKPLSDEEKEIVMKSGAVWHNHPNAKIKEVSAIWKSSDSKGNIKYCCNTHRAIAIKNTLKDAIKAFDFIKTTA